MFIRIPHTYNHVCLFFFQAEDCIRDRDGWLDSDVCSADLQLTGEEKK